MNISITNACNRRCQYCFQKDWYLPKKANDPTLVREMSVKDFTDLVLWFNESEDNKETVRLLGGESLLHSRFVELCHILEDFNLSYLTISNISVESEQFRKVLESTKKSVGWLVNTDYPKSQREVFLTNYKALCESEQEVAVSTTLLPHRVKESAFRMRELVKLYRELRGNTDTLRIRLSPFTPNPITGQWKPYDFSVEVCEFFNEVWQEGQTQAHFDCKVQFCELSESCIEAFRQSGISVPTGQCTHQNCPFDVLVDGSVIWCSSARFLKLNSWRDYKDYADAIEALRQQWLDAWKKMSYPKKCLSCAQFNPAKCWSFCIAKNRFYTNTINGESN